MKYLETTPPGNRNSHIECFWQFQATDIPGESLKHVIVPDGAVSLSYILLPTQQVFVGLTGPSIKAYKTDLMPGAVYAGIRLHPGTAGSILNANISDYRDVFGRQIERQPKIINHMRALIPAQLTCELLTPLLLAAAEFIVENSQPLDKAVCQFTAAVMKADGDANLNALCEELDIGPRQLRRRFKYQCGLTPKEFSRLRRVRRACIDMLAREGNPLADTANATGFSDQAHMSREFKDVFENSTSLVGEYLKQISHEALIEKTE